MVLRKATAAEPGPESWYAWRPDTWSQGVPHLAELHKEVGDPGLHAFPEGVVLRPEEAGHGEGSAWAPHPLRPAPALHSQAAALVRDEIGKVGEGEAVPEVEQSHDPGRPVPPVRDSPGGVSSELGFRPPGTGAWRPPGCGGPRAALWEL